MMARLIAPFVDRFDGGMGDDRELRKVVERLRAELGERLVVERALRESEARYRRLAENAPDIIYRFRVGTGRGFEYVNPAAERLLGYSRAELMADPDLPHALFHPDELPAVKRLLAAHDVLPNPTVLRVVARDGVVSWLEFREVGVEDEQGRLVAVEGVARDVTASKEAEARYRLIADYSADLIGIVDREARFVYASPSFGPLLGYRPEALLGRTVWEHVHPDDLPELLEVWAQMAAARQAEASFRYRRADGAWRWIEARGTVAEWQGATVAVISGRDVTERRRLEQQLAEATKMEGIGRLAGGVAHDFNNLLVVIGGYTELLIDALPPDSEALSDLLEVRKATDRAADLTRQLLAFARRQASNPQRIRLDALLGEIEPLVRRLVREDIELVSASPSDLWAVAIDPSQAEQVVMNLVVNARDAMPLGGRLLIETANVELDAAQRLHDSTVPPGQYVLLAVGDTGVGMTEEMQRRLFEPFFTTKAPGAGTGLGLSTCYGIVKQHGGHIWVSSELGRGTTVRIYLPRAEHSQEAPARGADAAPAGGSETVLIVEDEPTVRELAARVLRAQGYTVHAAANGLEALELVEVGALPPIDLLLSDVVMPGLGGAQLAARLAPRFPRMRTLFISGYADLCSAAGPGIGPEAVLLQKPFAPDTLAAMVRELLDRSPTLVEGPGAAPVS